MNNIQPQNYISNFSSTVWLLFEGEEGRDGWLAEAQIYIFWVEWIIRDLFKTHRKLYWEWVWDNHVKLCISMIRGIMIFSQRKKSTKKGDTVVETSRMEIMLMRIQPRPYNVIFASNSSVHSIFYTKVEQEFPVIWTFDLVNGTSYKAFHYAHLDDENLI